MRALTLLLAVSTVGLATLPAASKAAPGTTVVENSNDPSGNYRTLPDWARKAFAGRGSSR